MVELTTASGTTFVAKGTRDKSEMGDPGSSNAFSSRCAIRCRAPPSKTRNCCNSDWMVGSSRTAQPCLTTANTASALPLGKPGFSKTSVLRLISFNVLASELATTWLRTYPASGVREPRNNAE